MIYVPNDSEAFSVIFIDNVKCWTWNKAIINTQTNKTLTHSTSHGIS